MRSAYNNENYKKPRHVLNTASFIICMSNVIAVLLSALKREFIRTSLKEIFFINRAHLFVSAWYTTLEKLPSNMKIYVHNNESS
jgi:hypothetical protein